MYSSSMHKIFPGLFCFLLYHAKGINDREVIYFSHREARKRGSNSISEKIADFFNRIRYYHIVPQLIRDPQYSVGRKSDPYGSDFLEQIAALPRKTQEARLRRIQDALRVAIPQFQELALFKDKSGMTSVNILVEGAADEPVARKLLKHIGLEIGMIYGRRGKPYLLEQLVKYNQAAHIMPLRMVLKKEG